MLGGWIVSGAIAFDWCAIVLRVALPDLPTYM